ncbi:glycosyl transferase [Ferrigenium kumadai]|uniref:Glycosyl transferase n=1 Tax=Ferrigenium kumadai TaxID=1682490 RepID=A0AAN1T1V6_9PROT|nr:glycosyltransferase family 2 protein [Ferrigenium kumadai]BBJ00621.1 glycosyl transferase [Ferrigenium kumadai]
MVNALSVVIPVYRNEGSIPTLIAALSDVAHKARQDFDCAVEVVFVVDGSPDNSYAVLAQSLPAAPFASQLLLHSRNFGSFAAIRTGLQAATGQYFGVIAADLQEPPELVLQFLERLIPGDCDVVVGCRENREDPLLTRIASDLFWKLYKKFIIHDIPEKGVDVFGCNRTFRDKLLSLEEANSSLVGLIFWLGFRRAEVSYDRRIRQHGKSAWTLKKKINYLLDSVFSFTDLPIKLLSLFGLLGIIASAILGTIIILAKILGGIAVPGYAATVLTVIFFGALNSLGFGIIGAYAWRAYENTKGRPLSVVMLEQKFDGTDKK